MDYETIIGLEVHLQLATESKAFCGCSTKFGAGVNTQTCPVCLGFPGSLPVLNKKVLEFGIKVGLGLNCQIQNFVKFDRKNYFYPDLPKNYQISQYDLPLALDGFLNIQLKDYEKKVRIKRVHLEEDAGKLIHVEDTSLLDYNRAGMPLLEIVTEPDMNSPQEAFEYLKTLKAILKYLEVSDCDMEKGSLRCDANISLRKFGVKELGTKIELKNMNSFRAVKQGLEYEVNRQAKLLDEGKKIVQETRLWDELNSVTSLMRTKEEAQDYRYFPDPDLVPFILEEAQIKEIKNNLPELPEGRKKRFTKDYGLSNYDAEVLVEDKALADYFERCNKIYPKAKNLANWITGVVLAQMNNRNKNIGDLKLKEKDLVELISLVDEDKISGLLAKNILTDMLESGKTASIIVQEKNLLQISDTSSLEKIIEEVIAKNQLSVKDFKDGKNNAIMFLVGQVMKASSGKANPKIVQELLRKKIS
ncbi:MAG: Asp-tRNA(Asn)/Glu-tRNA(Gln) amidotransferase subunit GatB [Candidatus Omnitrophota bacterium]